MISRPLRLLCLFACVFAWLAPATPAACPFCNPTKQTLWEEISRSDAAALCRLVKPAPPPSYRPDALGHLGDQDIDRSKAVFEIIEPIRNGEFIRGITEAHVMYYGQDKKDQVFLLFATALPEFDETVWTGAIPLSEEGVKYVKKLPTLPESGPERYGYFLPFLKSDNDTLRMDAYEEFARAEYADVEALAGRLNKDELLDWIVDFDTTRANRKLYLVLLGVCGGEAEADAIETLIVRRDREQTATATALLSATPQFGGVATQTPSIVALAGLLERMAKEQQRGLDALLACYLRLRGEPGLAIIEQEFFHNDVLYTNFLQACAAVRFMGEETDLIPRHRLAQTLTEALNVPKFADHIIYDLSRWEYWEPLERLVELYWSQPKDTIFLHEPTILYLRVAADLAEEPIAKQALTHLAKIEKDDPETFDRAIAMMAFGSAARARPIPGKTTAEDSADNEELIPVNDDFDADEPPLVPVDPDAVDANEVFDQEFANQPSANDVAADDVGTQPPSKVTEEERVRAELAESLNQPRDLPPQIPQWLLLSGALVGCGVLFGCFRLLFQ